MQGSSRIHAVHHPACCRQLAAAPGASAPCTHRCTGSLPSRYQPTPVVCKPSSPTACRHHLLPQRSRFLRGGQHEFVHIHALAAADYCSPGATATPPQHNIFRAAQHKGKGRDCRVAARSQTSCMEVRRVMWTASVLHAEGEACFGRKQSRAHDGRQSSKTVRPHACTGGCGLAL
jgi:hypothetical protein